MASPLSSTWMNRAEGAEAKIWPSLLSGRAGGGGAGETPLPWVALLLKGACGPQRPAQTMNGAGITAMGPHHSLILEKGLSLCRICTICRGGPAGGGCPQCKRKHNKTKTNTALPVGWGLNRAAPSKSLLSVTSQPVSVDDQLPSADNCRRLSAQRLQPNPAHKSPPTW